MHTLSAKLTFHIAYAASLKDKRQVSRSLIEKTRHKFNVSIAEVATQDSYQTLTIGIALVSSEFYYAQDSVGKIISYMEANTDAELTTIEEY